MDEKESKEGVFRTDWLTVPRRTAFFTGPTDVGKFIGKVEKDSQPVEYFPEVSRVVDGRVCHLLTNGEWIHQETTELGEDDKQRFYDRFGTPIGPSKESSENSE